ncbi:MULTISPECIES: TRAP transporter small permease [unclassified Halomonas]|uniref:TRAP transporter small permease n=1 Tax=unclassified Halomonas TaxID=2609666 RepID=UPI0028872383|nr:MULTISPECIES: TRAP transporter small permease [unclassified Halomonas]MDT0499922.1 TRAP transporter small permease [Halomonas sp. PAR7]MDT0512327.1 TRAP transporter small permease [Halomonas sp. LES1]MDT0590960.1 TRAP transporter small permease [Halomonas sp. PAR8]
MNIASWKRPPDLAIGTFCILVMSALVVCVVWQVFSRYVLNAPSTFTSEAARFLMMWVGLLGGAYTVGLQRHLSIDLISGSLAGRPRYVVEILINLAILIFAYVVVLQGGIELVDKVLMRGQVSAVMRIPMGYVYLALPISGIFMIYYSALFVIDNAKKCLHPPNPDNSRKESL